MSVRPTKVQFNGGELSPWLEGRIDIAKYDKTAKLCRNFIPLAEGSLKRRGGTRFVSETLETEDLLFTIKTIPEDAIVFINGIERNFVNVATGDTVEYEVQAEGYETHYGKMVVKEDVEILVELTPSADSVKLEIRTIPEDAIVKIEGVVRRVFIAKVGQTVSYLAYKDGYEMKSGTVLMNENKVLDLTLNEEAEEGGAYGEWGEPVCFVACSAVFDFKRGCKAFIFRFTKGYLVIVFDANKRVPDDNDTRLFFNDQRDGYDAVALVNEEYRLARLIVDASAFRYKDLDGKTIAAISEVEMMVCGWPVGDDNYYASFYTKYDGTVLGRVVRIYYEGELVWKLMGGVNNG